MAEFSTRSGSEGLLPGDHVCWTVSEPATYLDVATALLREAADFSQKAIVFGPEKSEVLAELTPLAGFAIDPRAAVSGDGELDPGKVFAMFREQTEMARAEGYGGLRVVADMDWAAAALPNTDRALSFELMLGPLAKELEASIVCAYRTPSFDAGAIAAVLCVHEKGLDADPPQFKIFGDGVGRWHLSGEVDLAVASTFETAIARVTRDGGCLIDVSALEYIDVAGMREIARAGRASAQPIRLVGASPMLRRMWKLAGFEEAAPTVELVEGSGAGDLPK